MANTGGKSLHHQIDRLLQHGTVTGLTDAELLERYLDRRDEVAFEALVRMHGPMVLGLCRRLLRDGQDVEDAFQATFLILVRKAPSIRDRTLLANWLYGVAYRVAIRARMKASRRNVGKQPAELLAEVASDRAGPAESADWLPILDEELTRLPEKYRGPLVLCYLNGQTHEQSAGRLGIPVGTVRSRLARGRDLLKRRLERRGVAPSVVAIALGESTTKVAFLATVPGSLVNGTLVSASRFLSLPTATAALSAGTISAISLTQGVITAMFFSQLKVVALGIFATGAVASGVALAVSSSSGPAQREIVAESAPPRAAEPRVDPAPKQAIPESWPPPELAFTDRGDRQRTGPIARGPIHELEVQLDIATRHFLFVQRRQRALVITEDEFDEARGKVEIVEAKVKDLVEVFEEDRTRLELELAKANAETAVRAARVKIASRLVERNERLNARNKGAVPEEDAAVANDQLELAKAEEASSKADSRAAKAMIKVVDRRIEAAKVLLKKATAAAAKLPAGDVKPPTSPVPPPAR
jgi:RNA polymerase sigma factor (sigma-70 family)